MADDGHEEGCPGSRGGPLRLSDVGAHGPVTDSATGLIVFVLAVLGVLIASATVDKSDFGAQEAWFYVTLLTIGYMVSRGLAKSGSRDFYDDDNR